MRGFFATVLGGIISGLVLGFVIGKFQASQFAWTPDREINKGTAITSDGSAEKEEKSESEETSIAEKTRKSPRVKIDEEVFDFGIIEKNPSSERGEHPFYIENVGNADMTLADGGKGCFCTEFTISKTLLKPGEKATVLFKWDGARSGGVFNQGIRVLTNDPKRHEVTFAVKGLYTSPIISDPNEITFQNAPTASDSSRAFRILGFEKNEDGTPFDLQITEIELSDPERFSVELQKSDLAELTEEDLKHKLFAQTTSLFSGVLTMKAGMPQGAFQELLRVRTNSPKMPILETTITGQIAGAGVRIAGPLYNAKTTGQLMLGTAPRSLGKTTTLRLTIFDKIPANADTVKVKSVRPDWLKVSLTYPDEELQKSSPIRLVEATVEVPVGSPQGAFTGPEKEKLGEIVFSVGVSEDSIQEVNVPVSFAVTSE